jgi:hypothetical protein
MSAGRYSFTIEQGSTLNFELQYKNSSGSAINLSGYGGKMQIKSNYADNSPTIYLTLSSSLQADGTGLNFSGSNGSTPTASGSIGVFISADTSSLLTFDTALYDLEITSGSIVTRILEGQVKLSKEVTR